MTRTTDGTADRGMRPPGHRLPAGTRPGRVLLQVADLDRSAEYYGEVLGLRVLERSGSGAALAPRDTAEPLIELRERPGAPAVPREGRLGLFHYAMRLPDRPALGRLVRHLDDLGERAGASDHLVSEALYLEDPDGLGIEVYSDRPRSQWQHSGGQLVMATRPLDVGSVVREAGNEPWTGLPAGTTMGHVHLRVGDLDEAAAFYHEAVGLDKRVWSYPGALFLAAGGYHHHLGLNTWAEGAAVPSEDDARLIEWELVVPSKEEVEAVGESLRAAGYAVEPSEDGLVVDDPWSTTLRIRDTARQRRPLDRQG